MASLDQLHGELNSCIEYMNSLEGVKAILGNALTAIEPALEINNHYQIDEVSADQNGIVNTRGSIEDLINYMSSTVSQTDGKIGEIRGAIAAEEERIRREAEEAARKAAEDAKNNK